METNKEAIAIHKEIIEFDQKQIENYKKQLLDAEYYIKIWRVFKMVDELFLWFEIKGNYTLYCKQYNKLKAIKEQLEKQYKQQN